MTDGAFEIRDAGEPVVIALRGRVCPATVGALGEAIERWRPPIMAPKAIVDLSAVDDVTANARDALVHVNRALMRKVGRHVYLARTSRLRGLSLWVLHMAADVAARTVGTEGQAHAWLAADGASRLDANFRLLGVEEPPPRALTGAPETLTFTERVGVQAMGWISRITFGYWVAFTREMVRTYGLDGVKRWGDAIETAVEALDARFGVERAQLLIAMAAVWNGCTYCTTGHLYALNILYFKRTGRLFPIDEREVPRWYTLADERVVQRVVDRIADTDFADMIPILRRQLELRVHGHAGASSDDDRLIVMTNAAWDLVNECTIVVETSEIPPLHPTAARARGVQRAYARQRAAAGRPEPGSRRAAAALGPGIDPFG